jgi:hypothetical protein
MIEWPVASQRPCVYELLGQLSVCVCVFVRMNYWPAQGHDLMPVAALAVGGTDISGQQGVTGKNSKVQ